jgi:hypothetical protein
MITLTATTVGFLVIWIGAVALIQTLDARDERRRQNPALR